MVVVLCYVIVCSARLELSLLVPGSGNGDAGDDQNGHFMADQVVWVDELREMRMFIRFE